MLNKSIKTPVKSKAKTPGKSIYTRITGKENPAWAPKTGEFDVKNAVNAAKFYGNAAKKAVEYTSPAYGAIQTAGRITDWVKKKMGTNRKTIENPDKDINSANAKIKTVLDYKNNNSNVKPREKKFTSLK